LRGFLLIHITLTHKHSALTQEGEAPLNSYEYQRPLGKIEDIPELRNAFIAVYDTKDKKGAVRSACYMAGIFSTSPG